MTLASGPSIGARLDSLPVTRTHLLITGIIGIGAFFDLFDVFLAGVLGTVLTQTFGLNQVLLPAVLGSSFLGMFFGAAFLGALADRLGRRTAYLLNLAIYSAFTFAGALSVNAATLIAARFLAGFGIGAEPPLIDCYLSEIVPARRRGRLIALAYTIGFMGVPAVGFLARVVVPTRAVGVDGWRWLFVFGSLGSLIVATVQRRLPESPRWLALHGRGDEAEAIVSRLEQEAQSVGTVSPNGVDATQRADHAADAAPFFAPTVRAGVSGRRVVMLCVFQVCQTVGYYGFGTLVPLVLASKGFSVVTSLTYTGVTFIGYPIGSLLSMLFVETLDRRWLIVCSGSCMMALGLGLGLATPPSFILVLGFCYTLVSNVFSNALHIFQAEIFPTRVRATAAGSTYGLSRLSAAAMPFVLLPLLRRSGPDAMFAAIAIAMAVAVASVGLFGPSTVGRSLEEINARSSNLIN